MNVMVQNMMRFYRFMMTCCLFLDHNFLVILVHRIVLACFLLVILILILIIHYRLVNIVMLQYILCKISYHELFHNTLPNLFDRKVLVCNIFYSY